MNDSDIHLNSQTTNMVAFDKQQYNKRMNFKDDPSKSHVDAHMLISLMAQHPLLLQTCDTDKWSDPKDEFLAAVAAGPVYEFPGKKSLGTDIYPEHGVQVLNDLGYYMLSGGHGGMPADYEIFIRFMKMHFFATE